MKRIKHHHYLTWNKKTADNTYTFQRFLWGNVEEVSGFRTVYGEAMQTGSSGTIRIKGDPPISADDQLVYNGKTFIIDSIFATTDPRELYCQVIQQDRD